MQTHISIHTLTQETTVLITDYTRKVCHYFKCRTFFKVHELLESAFGQNSVSCLKGIPSCACGFLRRIQDSVACVQLFSLCHSCCQSTFGNALLSPALFFSLRRHRTSLIACLCCCHACVTLTLVRVGSHVSPLLETESASFPLGKAGSVFLHTSFSHVSFA